MTERDHTSNLARPWVAWTVITVGLVASALVLALRGTADESGVTSALPASAESRQVAEIAKSLPSADETLALVVYTRGDAALEDRDRTAIEADLEEFRDVAGVRRVAPPSYSREGAAALTVVSLSVGSADDAVVEPVEELRQIAAIGLPRGLDAALTGPAGFEADISAVFDGADVNLLITTVVVVAVLLLVTYRSPVLWLVPLAVIAIADQVAASIFTITSRATDVEIADGATTGIASILVFGAGTNYALLLVARYREELRGHEDRFVAMRAALRSAGPSILASGGTVVLSLVTLLAAELPFNRNVGIAGAIGIVIALIFALVLLPAVLVVFGRWLFWPFVPRVGTPDPAKTGFWARVGRWVASRPAAFLTAGTLLLVLLATGLTTTTFGLAQNEQFRSSPESVSGAEKLAEYFEAGSTQPLTIATRPATVAQVLRVARETPGVASVRPAEQSGGVATVSVVLEYPPGTDRSDDTIQALRANLDEVSTATLVGGEAAEDLDARDSAWRDLRVVVPLVLAVVAMVLGLLLRSAVAAALLIVTVVASFFAALGAGSVVFELLGYPALDYTVPLLSFLFLVALGVDYNIFLTARAREETAELGTVRGMRLALAVTGGVITSAGILLASVFTVLGVLPLVLLGQIGIIVGLGVVLDTLVVRSLLVPAIVTMAGARFWWPSRPDGAPRDGDGGRVSRDPRHPVGLDI
jgi:RND superfamily putative drug exporter